MENKKSYNLATQKGDKEKIREYNNLLLQEIKIVQRELKELQAKELETTSQMLPTKEYLENKVKSLMERTKELQTQDQVPENLPWKKIQEFKRLNQEMRERVLEARMWGVIHYLKTEGVNNGS